MATVPSIGRAAAAPAAADTTRELYERYARQIFAYCLVQLRNREEAEDATQTTFMNAFRGLERGVVPELESAWLYKIAQHVCLTRKRAFSRRRRIEATDDFAVVQELATAPATEAEDFAQLREALHGLPEQQRRAIVLREWQGLSYREIADELELSQAAVETLLFRARRNLGQALGRLRTTSDVGGVVAAIKSLLYGGGTKVAATLVTVATTSVVAATPVARQSVVHLVDAVTAASAPPAHVAAHPAPKPPRTAVVVTATTALPQAAVRAAPTPVRAAPVLAALTTARRAARPAPAPAAGPSVALTTQAAPAPSPAAAPEPAAAATAPAVTTTVAPPPASAPPPPAPSLSAFTPAAAAPATTTAAAPVPPVTTAPAATTSDATTTAAPPPPTPSISGTSPSGGAVGSPVYIAGKNLGGATAVRFNGTSADSSSARRA